VIVAEDGYAPGGNKVLSERFRERWIVTEMQQILLLIIRLKFVTLAINRQAGLGPDAMPALRRRSS